jgi:hypothetical protein
MKIHAPMLILAFIFSNYAYADCFKNQSGNVVCGKGHCESDQLGKVYCADAGGDAVRNSKGKVVCGKGNCETDGLQKVWCSKEVGGGAAVNSNGKVVCLGGCEEASTDYCREAQ